MPDLRRSALWRPVGGGGPEAWRRLVVVPKNLRFKKRYTYNDYFKIISPLLVAASTAVLPAPYNCTSSARRAHHTRRAFVQIIVHSMLRVSTLQSALLGRDSHVFPSSVLAFHSRVLSLHSQCAHPDGMAAAAAGDAPVAVDSGAPRAPLPPVRWRRVERRLARWFARSVGTQKASRRSLSTMCSDSGVCTSRTSTPRYLKLTRRRSISCRSQ